MTDLREGWTIGDEEIVSGVLRVTAQPLWVVDPEGLIRFANPAAVETLGYDSAQELLGRHSHETIHYRHPDGTPYPASECPMLLPRKTGETVRSDLDWFFRRDGSMFPVSYVSAPIRMPEGRGAVVAFADIEERLLAERALRDREAGLTEQQDALRRVASLVASDAPSAEVFAAVAREVGRVLGTPLVQMSRYEPDGTATVIGVWSERPHPFHAGSRWPLEGPTITLKVLEMGGPARLDDLAGVPGALAEAVRGTGIRSVAGAPIVVGGRVWGVMATGAAEGHESRRAPSTVWPSSPSWSVPRSPTPRRARRLRQLAEEQAGLRRVATIVADGAPPGDVFAAVAAEAARLLGITTVVMCRFEHDHTATAIGAVGDHPFRPGTSWPLDGPSMLATVRRTGRPARIDDYTLLPGRVAHAVRTTDANAGVTAPIIVDGEVWGAISVGADSPLPLDTEGRLSQFADLVATAISKTQASEDVRALAEEQAALRRLATIVAQGAAAEDIFALVAQEIARVTGLEMVMVGRYEHDRTVTLTGAAGEHPFQPGTRWPLDGKSVSSQILDTGRSVSSDPYHKMSGTIAAAARSAGMRAGVGAPVIVDGRIWGNVTVGGTDRAPLPANIERRLTQFTELIATAVSNAQARQDLGRLAEGQAALRRVATKVARGAPPDEIFRAVAARGRGPARLPIVALNRYETDGTATVIGAVGDHPFQTGTSWTLEGPSLTGEVNRTGRPARVNDYADVPGSIGRAAHAGGVHAGVGVPIIVDGNVWGVISAGGGAGVPLLPDAEDRLTSFAELIATAVSNAQARQEVRRLLDEQAALRRIATLVARGAKPQTVFDAVCEETGRVFGAATANLAHFTPDGINLTISGWSLRGVHGRTGTRLPIDGDSINAIVQRTGAPGRCDSYEHAQGEIAALMRQLGVRSEVGAPVVVDGGVWGVLIAGTDEPEPLPAGTEHRLADFAELIATAVSNTTARSELIASRARIVAAGDEQRRRVVRDLHDGAQQRLVHALITLQLAASEAGSPPELARLLGEALEDTRRAIEELRELAHGLHPAVLTTRGLAAAVEELADRAPVPVHVDIPEQRLPAVVESAAYFIAAEALTNVAKYANASKVGITATISGGLLILQVDDDGAGGATVTPGSGLSGLLDRLAALDGTLTIDSPTRAGTRLRAEIPLPPPPKHETVASADVAHA